MYFQVIHSDRFANRKVFQAEFLQYIIRGNAFGKVASFIYSGREQSEKLCKSETKQREDKKYGSK